VTDFGVYNQQMKTLLQGIVSRTGCPLYVAPTLVKVRSDVDAIGRAGNRGREANN